MPEPEIRWTIKRNCSASPRQLAAVFASIVALSFAIGIGFAAYGLWMVLPFAGLELAVLAAAFICFGRHAGDFEVIELQSGQLRVEQFRGSHRSIWQVAAPRARIETVAAADGKSLAHLYVVAPSRRVEVGAALLDERRRELAHELDRALRSAAAA
jgi:uncharacterized membrane protein